jgi:hypothetical protein
VADADRICTAWNAQAAALAKHPPHTGGLAGVTAKTAAILDDVSTRFDSIRPPADEAAVFGRFLTSLRRRAEIARAVAMAARAHRNRQVQTLLAEGNDELTRMSNLSLQLGFKACLVAA